MNQVKSVIIVGVGGQGTLLASRVLGSAMLRRGVDVKVSEVHGMSQHGGWVVTYVRYGETAGSQVYSPIIEPGEADVVLAFEALEAARFLPYLKEGGTVIVNSQQIDPMPVITGSAVYPEHILDKIKAQGVHVMALDALRLAEQAGSIKAVNMVLIGAMARRLSLPREDWEETVRSTVPVKFIDMNLKAFALGYGAVDTA